MNKEYSLKHFLTGLYFVHRKILKAVELPAGGNFLDIGCGTGKLLNLLNEKFGLSKAKGVAEANLFGIDASPDLIWRAKENFKETNIKFKTAFAGDLPFQNNFFNFVVASLTAHHLSNEEKQKMVLEIARTLAPKGKALIADISGKRKGIAGHILNYLYRKHFYSNGNMETVEKFVKENPALKILSVSTQFGFIEHLLIEKA